MQGGLAEMERGRQCQAGLGGCRALEGAAQDHPGAGRAELLS